jgi:hypothetical protein
MPNSGAKRLNTAETSDLSQRNLVAASSCTKKLSNNGFLLLWLLLQPLTLSHIYFLFHQCCDSSVGTVTTIQAKQSTNCGSTCSKPRAASTPKPSKLALGSPSFLLNGYWGRLIPRGQHGQDIKPTAYFYLMQRLRMSGAKPPLHNNMQQGLHLFSPSYQTDFKSTVNHHSRGRVAQSVYWLTTGWTVWGSNPGGARFFAHVQTDPGAHPASCTMGIGSFPGVKRPRRGADHPPPPSAEVMKV